MNWQAIGNISLGLGAIILLVRLLLSFKVGRWLLAALWVVLTLGSLFSGDWHSLSDAPDVDDNSPNAGRYWLWSGIICLATGIIIRSLVGST